MPFLFVFHYFYILLINNASFSCIWDNVWRMLLVNTLHCLFAPVCCCDREGSECVKYAAAVSFKSAGKDLLRRLWIVTYC